MWERGLAEKLEIFLYLVCLERVWNPGVNHGKSSQYHGKLLWESQRLHDEVDQIYFLFSDLVVYISPWNREPSELWDVCTFVTGHPRGDAIWCGGVESICTNFPGGDALSSGFGSATTYLKRIWTNAWLIRPDIFMIYRLMSYPWILNIDLCLGGSLCPCCGVWCLGVLAYTAVFPAAGWHGTSHSLPKRPIIITEDF